MPNYMPDNSKVDKYPIAPKASYPVRVMRSNRHLPINNKEGVGSISLPLSQALHQNGAKRITRMWPLVSSVKTLYHEATWLVLPLSEKAGKTCKKMKIEH